MAQNTVPTKNNLINTKKSLRLAKTGYDLMERKRTILVREVMQRMDEASQIQKRIAEAYKEAYSVLRKAEAELGDCSAAAQAVPIDNSVELKVRSVMGVGIPEVSVKEFDRKLYYPLTTTSHRLDDAYILFNRIKALTAELAEVEASVCRLADAVSRTRKRTNALGNIMIPQLEKTQKSISDVLEEKEREDFSRLKVIKNSEKQ